jgi:hypothetical protein
MSMPSLRSSPWIRGAPHSGLARLMSRIQPTNFERHHWPAAASSRLPSPEQAKTRTMPADDRLRFDDHQGVQNARRNPIEAGKNEAIEVAEGESL